MFFDDICQGGKNPAAPLVPGARPSAPGIAGSRATTSRIANRHPRICRTCKVTKKAVDVLINHIFSWDILSFPYKEPIFAVSYINRNEDMKKFVAWSLMCLLGASPVVAQEAVTKAPAGKETKSGVKEARVVFDKTTIDLGTFSEDDPVAKCTFSFTNEGNAPLVIHQAIASCGCTVPTYTRMPVKPGEKGEIDVTYNGTGKTPGRFKKSITVRTNAKESLVRLYITGEMTASTKKGK